MFDCFNEIFLSFLWNAWLIPKFKDRIWISIWFEHLKNDHRSRYTHHVYINVHINAIKIHRFIGLIILWKREKREGIIDKADKHIVLPFFIWLGLQIVILDTVQNGALQFLRTISWTHEDAIVLRDECFVNVTCLCIV